MLCPAMSPSRIWICIQVTVAKGMPTDSEAERGV